MSKKNENFWGTSAAFDLLMEVLLLVIIFLVPVIFDRRLGIVFSGTKIAWLRLFVSFGLGLWALKVLIFKEHRFIRTVLDWPVAGFLLSTTVATLTSVHVYTSLTGFYGRYEGLTTWYIYGLLFLIVTNYLHSFAQLKRMVMAVLPAATIMSIYSIIQRQEIDPYQWGGVITWQRVIGTIGQPNFLAAYMLMAFFLVLAVLLFKENNGQKPVNWYDQLAPLGYLLFSQSAFIFMIYNLDAGDVGFWYIAFGLITAAALFFAFTYERLHPLVLDLVLIVSLLLFYVCILYTQSRGGYMGLFTGLTLFTIVAGRRAIIDNWRKILVLGGLIFLISGLTMINPEYSPFQRFTGEVTTIKNSGQQADENQLELKGAAGSRGETWKSGFRILADYPVFGIGPEVLKMVFPRYETDLFRFKEAFHVKQDRCHNESLDVSVKHGLVTFFLYGWLLLTLFGAGFSKAKRLTGDEKLLVAGLLAACLGYLVQNQFSFGVVAITSLFWLIWGMLMVVGEGKDKEQDKARKNIKLDEVPWLAAAVVVLAVGAAGYIGFLSFNGDIMFKLGKTKLEMRQLPGAIDDLKSSLSYMPLEGGTISHLAITELNNGQLPLAIETLNYGVRVDAYNADNLFMLARIYFPVALARSQKYCEEALKVDPYYAEVYLLLGIINEKNGRLAEAAALYEKAFYCNPNLPEPMQRLEAANLRLGRADQTGKVFERALVKYGDNLSVMVSVANLYFGRGEVQKARRLGERMIRLDPQNVNGYLVRAGAELRLKSFEPAWSDLQQAVMLDPKNIQAHILLGQLYEARGESDKARAEMEQVKELR